MVKTTHTNHSKPQRMRKLIVYRPITYDDFVDMQEGI